MFIREPSFCRIVITVFSWPVPFYLGVFLLSLIFIFVHIVLKLLLGALYFNPLSLIFPFYTTIFGTTQFILNYTCVL